ncbi:CD59 glycoprotein-like [Pelobates fuscus]|uniref:CD59 glycoprotein-like n=1 Tax=Pelobates fuscus TaxID=191477 RepID=UPI002FE48594
MNGLTNIFFILLSCQIGNSLRCYACVEDECTITTCFAGQACGKTVTNGLHAKMCVPQQICDFSVNEVKTYCCHSDLCNSAVSARMSFVTVIAALVALWVNMQ